jgi:hypothetical protein
MERRLAAILAADVVGYSRLIRADEEGTIAAFKVSLKARPPKGRISLERRTDLPQQVVEAGVPDCRVALLDVDLDLDRVLVIGVPEAAQRLLRLARTTVAQDDQPPSGDLLGQHAAALDDGAGQLAIAVRRASNTWLGLARYRGRPS